MEPEGGAARGEPPSDSPLPFPAGAEAVWLRRSLPTRPSVLAHAMRTWVATYGSCRVSVPVDLRRRVGLSDRAVANLTGLVHVDLADADTDETIRAKLASELPSAIDAVRAGQRLVDLPLWLLASAGRRATDRARAAGRGPSSLTLSNLGRQDVSVFDTATFRGRALYWIPPMNPGAPLFITLTGHAGGVELCAGACDVEARALVERIDTFVAAW